MKAIQYPPSMAPQVTAPATSDTREFFRILKRNRWGFLVSMLFGLLLAWLYLLTTPNVFEADALMRLSQSSGADEIIDSNSQQASNTPLIKEESDLVRSREVLEPIIATNRLQIAVQAVEVPVLSALAKRWTWLRDWLEAQPKAQGYAWREAHIDISELKVPQSWHNKELTLITIDDEHYAVYDQQTMLVEKAQVGRSVSARAGDDGLLDMRVEQISAQPNTAFAVTYHSLQTALTDLRESLVIESRDTTSRVMSLSLRGNDAGETANLLNEIAQKYSDVKLGWESESFKSELGFFEQRLPELKRDMQRAEARLARYQRQNNSAVGVNAQTNALVQRLASEESKLLELERERLELRDKYTGLHPSVAKLDKEIDTYQATIESLRNRIPNIARISHDLGPLEREVEATRKLYTELNERAQRLRLAQANTVGSVQIVDLALPQDKPVAPKRKLVYALAALASLFAYALWTMLRASLSSTIDDDISLSRHSGLPVFMNIPRSEVQQQFRYPTKVLAKKGELVPAGSHEVLAIRAPEDFSVENLRGLRSMLSDLMFNARNNILMICSPLPAMGKSFVSINLAVLLAQSGKRVLLIDADYQRGYIHKTFAIDGGPGLVDAVAGTARPATAVKGTGVPNLYVLPRGHHSDEIHSSAPNEGDLQAFLARITPAFDIAIIDTPPILSVATATTIGRAAGTTLMVVKESEVKEQQLKESIRRLQYAGVSVNGCILNASSQSASHYAYYKDRMD
ncbi:MAG: GNVR domain-containing protein [Granulosicoccaceae bacterium]